MVCCTRSYSRVGSGTYQRDVVAQSLARSARFRCIRQYVVALVSQCFFFLRHHVPRPTPLRLKSDTAHPQPSRPDMAQNRRPPAPLVRPPPDHPPARILAHRVGRYVMSVCPPVLCVICVPPSYVLALTSATGLMTRCPRPPSLDGLVLGIPPAIIAPSHSVAIVRFGSGRMVSCLGRVFVCAGRVRPDFLGSCRMTLPVLG